MTEFGAVSAVYTQIIGDELVGAHATAATVLQLDDASDFPGSGSISTPLGLLSFIASDAELNTLTLAAGLASPGLADGDRIEVWDATRGSVLSELVADVILEGTSENSEPLTCTVMHNLVPYLPEGIRTDTSMEQAELEERAGTWWLVNLPGLRPSVDASYQDASTVPSFVPTAAPSSSPAIERISGTVSSLIVQVAPVDLGTRIEYHLSDVDGFTPSSATLVADTESLVAALDRLGASANPLAAGVTYYVRSWAYNIVGHAPAASAQFAASLNLDNVDVQVAQIFQSDSVMTGSLTIGQIAIRADDGITIGPADARVLHFPANGDPLSITAEVNAQRLSVDDNLAVSGTGTIFGAVGLNGQILAPGAAPTLTGLTGDPSPFAAISGLFIDEQADYTNWIWGLIEKGGDTSQLAFASWDESESAIYFADKTTLAYTGGLGGTWGSDWIASGGLCYIANPGDAVASYYLIGEDPFTSLWRLRRINASTGVQISSVSLGTNAYPKQPRIFASGSQVGVAYTASPAVKVRLYDPIALTLASTVTLSATVDGNQHIGGAFRGDAGTGTTIFYILIRDGRSNVEAYSSAWARDSSHDFVRAAVYIGMTYDSVAGRMVGLGKGGTFYRQGKYPIAKSIQAKFAWYDGDAGGGTHETQTGLLKTYTLGARQVLQASVPSPPDAFDTNAAHTDRANQVRLYASDDAGATWRLQTLTASPWTAKAASVADWGAGTPNAGTAFPVAAFPGQLASSIADSGVDGIPQLILVRGDGAYRLGNLTSTRHFGARSMASQATITSGVVTKLGFGAIKEAATGLSWDTTNTQFVIAKPGIYSVIFVCQWDNASTAGRRISYIYKNGSQYAVSEVSGNISSAAVTATILVAADIPCVAGDTIDARVLQNTGGNLAVNNLTDPQRHFFSCGFVAQ